MEEQKQCQTLKDKVEALEIELKSERKKVAEDEKRIQALEANLFDAGHQLKEALIAANHAEELKRKFSTIQKRFLLFREVNISFIL